MPDDMYSHGYKISSLILREEDQALWPAKLERVGQTDGPDRWAVRMLHYCLTHKGEWVWEPSPSSRSKGFLKTARWDSAEDALAAWDKFKEQDKETV